MIKYQRFLYLCISFDIYYAVYLINSASHMIMFAHVHLIHQSEYEEDSFPQVYEELIRKFPNEKSEFITRTFILKNNRGSLLFFM
jgi:hypothetical protein